MASINTQQQAEILRKAKAGIALTNPTSATTSLYNQYKPAATPKVTPTTPKVTPGTPESARSWIDSSNRYGGVSGYTAMQQNKYNQAVQSGDQDMLTRLAADMKRVGYTLKDPGSFSGVVDTNPSGPSASDLISGMYNNNLASQMQALQKARDTALQGLNGIETTARQGAYDSRNQADVVNAQNAQQLKEVMANNGLSSSGDNITANAQLGSARQGALNNINQSMNNTLTDVGERRTLINNNSAGDEQALLQQLQAARDNMLVNQMNQDRSFGLQQGGLTGNYNGSRTLAGQQFDYGQQTDQRNFDFQKATQEWNQNFQQGQFDWSKASDMWDRTFKEKNFAQQVQDAAASRGLQWAHLAEQQKARIADDLFKQKSFGLQQSEFNWSKDPNNPDNKYKSWQSDPNNPDNLPKSSQPSTKQIESTYVSNLNKVPPDKLKQFFSTEQSSIINDLGIDGYNRLYGTYFDQYGLPKKR